MKKLLESSWAFLLPLLLLFMSLSVCRNAMYSWWMLSLVGLFFLIGVVLSCRNYALKRMSLESFIILLFLLSLTVVLWFISAFVSLSNVWWRLAGWFVLVGYALYLLGKKKVQIQSLFYILWYSIGLLVPYLL